jgi:hypothetical protein
LTNSSIRLRLSRVKNFDAAKFAGEEDRYRSLDDAETDKTLRKKKISKNAITNEATTLRRHVESYHKVNKHWNIDMRADACITQAAYEKWCGLNNFESKLPKVVRERKDAALAADRAKQQSLDPHLTKEQPREKVIPYSDELFRDAAVQWLVETHQVYSLILPRNPY